MNDNPFSAWADQLLNYQRQYQNAWQALVSPPQAPDLWRGVQPSSTSNPWTAALEQWWKTVQPDIAAPAQDFCAKLVEQGKTYFQVTDAVTKASQQAATMGESASRWHEVLGETLDVMKAMFGGHKGDVQAETRQATAFWELPLNTWQRAVASSSLLPGDFLQSGSALGINQVRDQLHGRVNQVLSTPAIGSMREQQEQVQNLVKLQLDYQQALQDYAATYDEIGVKCVEALQEQIQQRMVEGNPIESLREVHDLWIDSCEQAYANYVVTDKYVGVYGRLVNSLMALTRHGTMMVDQVLSAMNMPTRSEVDTLHRRLQETRRESKVLRAELDSLRKMLRSEMQSSRRSPQTGNGRSDDIVSRVGSTSKAGRAGKAALPASALKSSAKARSRAKRSGPSAKQS
jgi:polyhydroxyalkanoate synthase subunit PhaE